jgi:hypothetical protein
MNNVLLGSEAHLTFKGNLKQSRYGWLRLTPAYSVHLVADLLDRAAGPEAVVFDPYCGTGTTALVCAEKGLSSYTTDINPFLVWLASAKAAAYDAQVIEEFVCGAEAVSAAIDTNSGRQEWVPDLHQIHKWWDEETLHSLGRAMASIREQDETLPAAAADLLRIAFCRTLIERANVSFGHQSMSFKKRKAQESLFRTEGLKDLVRAAWKASVDALAISATTVIQQPPSVLLCDARALTTSESLGLRPGSVDCVITSPPYPNRMSYIRELRPYMYWLGYLSDGRAAGELDWQAIGGTWGCATSNVGKWSAPTPRAIPHGDFEDILRRIAVRSDLLSRYVHKYFYDMTDHVAELTRLLAPAATVHYIVGNSKFYDVLLPVQDIYAGLFAEAGLADVQVETIRKRSSKRELFEFVVSARKPA